MTVSVLAGLHCNDIAAGHLVAQTAAASGLERIQVGLERAEQARDVASFAGA
jgi:hypothetical protein